MMGETEAEVPTVDRGHAYLGEFNLSPVKPRL